MASGGQLKAAVPSKKSRWPAESGEARAAQIRVLIAEDNAINMKVALGILSRMGYKQVRAHAGISSAHALSLLPHNPQDVGDVRPRFCTHVSRFS